MVGEFGEVGYPWERFPVKPGMTGRMLRFGLK
jgi:hypothetical protein